MVSFTRLPLKNTKHQHWRGFRATFAWKRPPMLVFGYFFLEKRWR
jgi:hypothetical protein